VTPFDPSALVAMLRAFYPAVSAAAFVLARRERPEYFAGGVIFGSKGDKLRLPDTREFDCIVAAGGPASGRSWQCSLIDPTATGDDDPFALEDGPLVPLDEDTTIGPRSDPGFEALVAGELDALDHSDDRLAAAQQAAVEFDGVADLEQAFGEFIEPADEAHGATTSALDADPISDVLEATADHERVIDAALPDYDEPEPPDVPEPDPGDSPDEGKPEPPPF
jgi:hypothetical protein